MKNFRRMKNDRKAESVALVVVGIAMIVLAIGCTVGYFMSVPPAYNKQVHGFMDAARWTDNATEIKGYLVQAEKGMIDLKLTNDSNSKIFGWEQTISTSMVTQYKQIRVQIDRCTALEEMNRSAPDYQRNYEAGLVAVHNYIYDANGWGDDIAEGVYSNMNMTLILIAILLGILGLLLLFAGLA
jgi:hypothetical protein